MGCFNVIKILMGGSPCTHWSIAQKNNRETEPEGLGWELFKNFCIAKEKYNPDYFLYENNKSMAKAIKEQITTELGVEPILINSALVSAQNRQRYYWTNIPNVELPTDKGILLKDILESGIEPVNTTSDGKSQCLRASCYKDTIRNLVGNDVERRTCVAEPVCLRYERTEEGKALRKQYEAGEITHCFNEHRELHPRQDGKSNTLSTVLKDNLVACPVNTDCNGKSRTIKAQYNRNSIANFVTNGGHAATAVAEPLQLLSEEYYKGGFDGDLVGMIENDSVCRNGKQPSQQYRVYSCDGKSVCVDQDQRKHYIVPASVEGCSIDSADLVPFVQEKLDDFVSKYGYLPKKFNPYNVAEIKGKSPTITASCSRQTASSSVFVVELADGKQYPIYEVKDGLITIKDKQYPIKLQDGYYIIRKLTVTECKRLQTVPDTYIMPCSTTQSYKMLGNGWTVDVIAHILSYIPSLISEEIEVLSMYDGMSCGRIALNKLGANVIKYSVTEIDKYAIQTTMANYPDTIQLGDAFQVRNEDWGC